MQQQPTLEPESIKLSDLINLDNIKSLHAMSRNEQEEKGEKFIQGMMGKAPSVRTLQKTPETTPVKFISTNKKVEESPEDIEGKTWKRLHHMLTEFKSSEATLSESAGLVVNILQKLIQSKHILQLEPHEIELLEMANGHFQKLQMTTPFSCIPEKLGTDPETILKTFELLDEEINQDPGALFLARINTCFWTTVFLTDLCTVLQKILALEGCLDLFTKEEFGTYPLGQISYLISKPMQRMPRLAMFSTDWQNDLSRLSMENSPAMTAVNNLDKRFKKISQHMNRTVGFMEAKQEAMNKQKKVREENASMTDRLMSYFSKEDDAEKEAKLGETAFSTQDVYRSISKQNEEDLRVSRERENLQQQPLTQGFSAPEGILNAASKLSLQTPAHESTPRPQSGTITTPLQLQPLNNTNPPRRLPTTPQPQIIQPIETILQNSHTTYPQLNITPTPQLQTTPSQQNLISPISTNFSRLTLRTTPQKPLETTPLTSRTPSRRTLPQTPQPTETLPQTPEQQIPRQPNNTTTVNFNITHQTQNIIINNFYLGQQNTNPSQTLPEPRTESEPKFKSQSTYRGTMYSQRKEKPVCSEASMLMNNLYTKMTGKSPLQFGATLPQITLDPTHHGIHITINATSLKRKEGVNLSEHSQFGQHFKPSTKIGVLEAAFKNATELNAFLSSSNINDCDIKKLYGELCEANSIMPNESFFNTNPTVKEEKPSNFFSSFLQ